MQPSLNSTSRSTSLVGFCSPRSTEPSNASHRDPMASPEVAQYRGHVCLVQVRQCHETITPRAVLEIETYGNPALRHGESDG